MKDKTENILWINVFCILGLAVVTLPLLLLGHFNYPAADDWSLAVLTHQVVENGGSIGDFFAAIGKTIMIWREKGEPRYANALLASIQPGIWGEHFYRITPWLMIGSLCVSEIMLCLYLLKECQSKKWVLPIAIPSLMLQILCAPYPGETFYWYTGAVNYTFIFSLSLILLTIFLKLKDNGLNKKKSIALAAAGCMLAFFVGGDNYASSLSSACLFAALSFWLLIKDRKAFLRTLPITLITICALLICVAAPGNQVRINKEFGGNTSGILYSIAMSLRHAALILFSWTTLKIVFMILLILPFLWKALKEPAFAFRYPLFFTLFTFGVYASQIVPTMYVGGNAGGGRMGDILYYAYHVWLLLNAGYWLGWLQRTGIVGRGSKVVSPAGEAPGASKSHQLLKQFQGQAFFRDCLCRLGGWVKGHLTLYFLMAGLLLAGIFCATELRQATTYRACVWLIRGDAREYAAAWEERLAILKDDSIKEVYFEPLPGRHEMVFYADFEPGEHWVNTACGDYYKKAYVGLRPD